MQPDGCRMHFLLRYRQFSGTDILERIELDLLEAHDLPVHAHIAMHAAGALRSITSCTPDFFTGNLRQRLDHRVVDGIGEDIALSLAYVGFSIVVIEPL